MRLRGTLTEDLEREQLRASRAGLLAGKNPAPALAFLGFDPATAHVINWIPEQGEDLFVVLVAGREIVSVDVPRDGSAPILLKVLPLSRYKPYGRPERIRIAVALQLTDCARRSPDGQEQ